MHNVAQMSIVLDEGFTSQASNEPQVSPSASSDASMSQGSLLYHCQIRDQNPAGALADGDHWDHMTEWKNDQALFSMLNAWE